MTANEIADGIMLILAALCSIGMLGVLLFQVAKYGKFLWDTRHVKL